MSEPLRCARCAAPLTPASSGAVCPACLLKLGLSGTDAGETMMASRPDEDTTRLTPRPDAAATMLAAPAGDAVTALGTPSSGGDARTVLAASTRSAAVSMSRSTSTPTQIGPYRLVKPLGEGGMGVVYLAEQDEPIRRTVALKLIKLGMDTHEVVARFEAERQALALMDHQHIASVLDAGATSDGRPYFVMEYVPGLPITEYCDARRLDTRDRLALFLDVCSAIQHAHQKGIIHRDLKPSNVLVVEQDGQPVPKVIDFGIAKATDQRLTEKTAFTQHGMLVGTPEYMSPEQADPSGTGDIDTRSDIYSLGIMLYELLVGSVPFSGAQLREAGYTELIRIIREEEPPKPSTRLTTAVTSAELAARRQTKVLSLTQELRGDLDWITLRALEKDRTRRYPSVSEFAADLTRYLNNEPVVARPPSVGYRVQKFVRRNRLAVTAAALIFFAVVAGLVVSSVLYVREGAARRTAVLERDRADAATVTATAKAESEKRQRDLADTATKAEAQAKIAAQQNLEAAQTNLYFYNVITADRELQANNIRRVDDLLDTSPAGPRNWEWNYLMRAGHMEESRQAIEHQVQADAFTADGLRFITAGLDGTLNIWDARTRRLVRTVPFGVAGKEIEQIRLSRTGAALAVRTFQLDRGFMTALSVWDTLTGRERFTIPKDSLASAFSPDESRLVTVGIEAKPDGSGKTTTAVYRLQDWDAHTGAPGASLGEQANPVHAVTFSPDGTKLAVVTGPILGAVAIKVVDARDGHELTVLGATVDSVTALAFSPDGAVLAAGVTNKNGQNEDTPELRVWAVSDRRAVWPALKPGRAVDRVAFSPDGRHLAAALADRSIRVLDRTTGREEQRLVGHGALVKALAFTPDGTRLMSASDDKTIRTWAMPTSGSSALPITFSPEATDTVSAVALSSDRSLLLAFTAGPRSGPGPAGAPATNLRAWNIESGHQLLVTPQAFSLVSATVPSGILSENGRRMLTPRTAYVDAGGGRVIASIELTVRDVATDREVSVLRPERIKGPELSNPFGVPNLASIDSTIQPEYSLSPSGDRVVEAAGRMSMSVGRAAAAGNSPKVLGSELNIWDTRSGKALAAISLPNMMTGKLMFSPNGAQIAAEVGTFTTQGGTVTQSLRLYDSATGRQVHVFQGSEDAAAPFVFSRDGGSLAAVTGKYSITIWDTHTGEKRALLAGQSRIVSSLAFSPDGTRLVSASADGTVALWDTVSGNQVLTLRESGGGFVFREIVVAGSTASAPLPAASTDREGAAATATINALLASAVTARTIAFSDDGRQVVLVTTGRDGKGMKMQIGTWDASARR